jgi:hypothetical protein
MRSELTRLDCPFGSDDCPKQEKIEESMKNIRADIDTIKRTLYVMCGILIMLSGVTII